MNSSKQCFYKEQKHRKMVRKQETYTEVLQRTAKNTGNNLAWEDWVINTEILEYLRIDDISLNIKTTDGDLHSA